MKKRGRGGIARLRFDAIELVEPRGAPWRGRLRHKVYGNVLSYGPSLVLTSGTRWEARA